MAPFVLAVVVMGISEVLAELYRDRASAERVAVEAGVDVSRVSWAAKAADTWQALLNEASHQHKLPYVVGVALREYPQYPPLITALLSSGKPDGSMTSHAVIPPPSNESESAVIARLATQLEYLTIEVKRVSDGLNGIKGLNAERIERGLDDIIWMRVRVSTLMWAVTIVTGMTMLLGVAFVAHM